MRRIASFPVLSIGILAERQVRAGRFGQALMRVVGRSGRSTVLLMSLLLTCADLAAARAAVAPGSDDPVSFHADAWLGACDNLRDCTLFGFAEDDAAVLRVRLPEGRAASGSLLLRPEHPLRSEIVRLQPGRRGAALSLRLAAVDGGQARAALDEAAIRDLLPAMRQGGRLSVTGTPSRPSGRVVTLAVVRLAGASQVLDWIARTQRRPASPAPSIGESAPPDPDGPPPPDTLPAAVAMLPAARGCMAEDSERPGQTASGTALSSRIVLWRIPCGSGNFSQNSLFVLAEQGQEPVPAVFGSPPQFPSRPTGILVNAELDDDGVLTAIEPSRGLMDCGDVRRYRWDGRRFRLLRAQLMTACHGLPVEDWPVVYRAGLDGRER